MGLFSRKPQIDLSEDPKLNYTTPQPESPATVSLSVLFPALPAINAESLKILYNVVSVYERKKVKPGLAFEYSKTSFRGRVGWIEHTVDLFGSNTVIPEADLEICLDKTPMTDEGANKIRSHKAQVQLFYRGTSTDATEQYIALFKVARGLRESLGLVIRNAANAVSYRQFQEFGYLSKGVVAARNEVPIELFCGLYTHIDSPEEVYVISRGHHFFGVPDFVYFGTGDDGKTLRDLYAVPFKIVKTNGPDIEAGGFTFLPMVNLQLNYKALDENTERFKGPGKTLQVSFDLK